MRFSYFKNRKVQSTPPPIPPLPELAKKRRYQKTAVKGIMYNQEKKHSGLENHRRYWGEDCKTIATKFKRSRRAISWLTVVHIAPVNTSNYTLRGISHSILWWSMDKQYDHGFMVLILMGHVTRQPILESRHTLCNVTETSWCNTLCTMAITRRVTKQWFVMGIINNWPWGMFEWYEVITTIHRLDIRIRFSNSDIFCWFGFVRDRLANRIFVKGLVRWENLGYGRCIITTWS